MRTVYFIVFLSILGSTSIFSQGCLLDADAIIQDNATTLINIDITGAVNNDLENANQGLCGIAIDFDHDAAGNIEMFLTSPSGQEIQLMGPGGINSELTQFTNWEISFVPCGETANPDPFRSAVWDNTENWFVNTNPTGSYYPNLGCLEDFNIGPVNGVWQLSIIDLSEIYDGNLVSIELIFCDDAGIDCTECDPNAGVLNFLDGGFCQFDPALNFQPTIPIPTPDPVDYSYNYVVSLGGNIVDYLSLPDLSNFPVGDYLVCGLSYLNSSQPDLPVIGSPLSDLTDLINNEVICAAMTDQCSFIVINDEPDMIVIDTIICQGNFFSFQGVDYGIEDQYEVFFGVGSCDSVAEINLSVVDINLNYGVSNFTLSCNTPSLNATPSISANLTNPTFNWIRNPGNVNVGNTLDLLINQQGTYMLTVTSEGCSETITVTVTDDGTLPEPQIVSDVLTCEEQETIINIESTPNTTYFWEGPGINGLNENDEDPLVDMPGIYTVTITDNNINCTYTASHEVLQNVDIETPVLSATPLSCTMLTSNITVFLNDPTYSFLWSFEGNNILEEQNIEVSEPGIYTLTANSPNGCSVSVDVEVIEQIDIPELTFNIGTINCIDVSTQIEVLPNNNSYQYNWEGPEGFLDQGAVISANQEGNYTVTVITDEGCETAGIVELIKFDDIPGSVISATPIGCNSGGEITLSTPIPIDTYTWHGPDNYTSDEANPTVPVSGIYTVDMITSSGCVATDTILVEIATGEIGISIPNVTISCNDPELNINVLGDITNLSFNWEGPGVFTSIEAEPLVSQGGWYNVTVTDAIQNCVFEDAVFVNDQFEPSSINLGHGGINCYGGRTITILNPEDIVNFTWSGEEDFTEMNSGNIFVEQTGWYYLEHENIWGCIGIDSTEMKLDTIKPDLIIDDKIKSLTCFEDKVRVVGESTFNVNYEWTSSNGFQSNIANPLVCEDGIYIIEVTFLRNGCTTIDSVEVVYDTIPPLPTFDLQNNGILDCVDEELFVTIADQGYDGSVVFSWSGDNPFTLSSNEDSIFVNTIGTYQLEIQGDNGCTNVESIQIDQDVTPPDYTLIEENISCVSEIAQVGISPNEDNLSVNWSGPDNFQSQELSFFTENLGMYIVELTNSLQCTVLDTVNVAIDTLNPILTPIFSDTLDCEELSISIGVESTEDIAEYVWSGNNFSSNEAFPIITDGGTYLLTVTAVNGCTATAILNVEQDDTVPFVNTVGGVIDCIQPTAELSATNTAIIPSYLWEGPNLFTNESNPIVQEGGTYFVTVTDINGCAKVDSAIVVLDTDPPDTQAFDNSLPCVGDSVQINGFSLDPNVEYRWLGPNGFTSELQSPMVGEVGEYVLLVIGENGCTGLDTAIVDDVEVPPVFDVADGFLTCEDSSVEICGLFVNDDLSTEWLDDQGNSLSFDSCIDISEAGTYSLLVTGQNGCTEMQDFTVGIDTVKPIIVIDDDFVFQCENIEICLDASNSSSGPLFSNTWSTEDGNILTGHSSLIVKVDQEGFYELEVTDNSNGCSTVSGIVVAETTSTLSDLNFSVVEPSCFGFNNGIIDVINVVGGQEPYEYSFMGSTFSSNSTFNFLAPGVYLIEVKDANGCTYLEEVSVGFGNDIQLQLGGPDTITVGDSIDVSAITNISPSQIQSTIWEPNIPACDVCTSFTFTPEETITIQLTIIDENGCSATDRIVIVVEDDSQVYVPNIFSPDGNGINDLFVIYGSELVEQVEIFQVMDRWGDLLHEAENFAPGDESFGWDGNFRGRPVNPDVFVYIAELRMITGKVELIKGTITLIR